MIDKKVDINGEKSRLALCFTTKKFEIKDDEVLIYISDEDHFDYGEKSPVDKVENIKVASTNEIFKVVGYDKSTPYQHYIIIKSPLIKELEKGDIILQEI